MSSSSAAGRKARSSLGAAIGAVPSDAPVEADCRLMASATQRADRHGLISMRIGGGVGAPGQARRSVLSQLDGHVAPTMASDVALVVSELVTNSVVHANVGPRRTLTVELMLLDDRVRISVIDPGSRLEPRILPLDHERVGGMGLFLVNQLSEDWGVARDGIGGTRVWCDILLHRSGSSELRAGVGEPPSARPG